MKRSYIAKRFQSSGAGLSLDTEALAKYKDIIDLSIGDTDFTTDESIINAAFRDAKAGHTHYGDPKGDPELIDAVCRAWEEDFGQRLPRDHVLVSASSCLGMALVMLAILDPGDEVVIPTPAFGLYETVTRLAGAVPVYLDTARTGFQLTYEALCAAITPRTKALVLNSPNNPTGAVYTEASLAAVCRAVGDRPIFILCDDVYRGLCTRPCPDPAALPGLRERLLIAQSFSKPWAMTGWRIGYLMGSAPVIRKLTALHGHILTCAPSMLQAACETALETDTAPMRETYAKRRALVLRRLHAMGLCCPIPEGAFYAFPDIRAFGLCSEAFCLRLIAEAGVAAVPGSCFGTEGHIRISYCCGEQMLERGMDRLEAFLEKLKQERRT